MRATEIIRSLLDLIDNLEVEDKPTTVSINTSFDNESGQQIQDLKTSPCDSKEWDNSPVERISDLAAVTTNAGGGPNGPKHPDDIRIKDPRGFE